MLILSLLFVVGFISLFIWWPLGLLLLLLCFFGLLFRIADKDNAGETAQAAQQAKEQEQDDSLADLRSAAKVLEAKAKAEGEGSPAEAAHQQVVAELEKEEALAAERHRRKAEHDRKVASRQRQASTERFWIWCGIGFFLLFLIVGANA